MGKVRPAYIKNLARQIVKDYKPYLSTDFEENKKIIPQIVEFQSKRYRNRVVGYVTRLMKLAAKEEKLLEETAREEF